MTEHLSASAKHFSGFFKIWRTNKITGESELLVNQPNKILYQGADLLAYALAGVKYARISHMYVGYANFDDTDNAFTAPVIDKDYDTLPFSSYGVDAGDYETYGYFRLPLSYSPTFQTSGEDYEHNTVVFTTIMAFDSSPSGQSDTFLYADNPTIQSHLFEVALSAALDPTTVVRDQIFSRATFAPIMFDPSYNLTISWGVNFLS